MDTAATFAAVRERFETEVATPQNLTVHHDNAPAAVAQSDCILQLDLDGPGRVVAAGGPGASRWRTTGRAIATLRVPASVGDDRLMEIGDAIKAAFRGVVLTVPLVYFPMEPEFVGRAARDGAHCLRTMSIPFEAEQLV
jgi:hypothetical protein